MKFKEDKEDMIIVNNDDEFYYCDPDINYDISQFIDTEELFYRSYKNIISD